MMKISKPVLTNDFLLSPVQFTSLNTIVFKNVKSVYDGNEKILLEYEHSSKIEASSRDWVGIFPRGWTTLQQYVTFEWVSQSFPNTNNEQNKENGDMIRRTLHFCPKYHIGGVSSNLFYQFVYISKQIEVLGVSTFFRFDISSINDSTLELECLVPVSNKLQSTSFSDIGVLMANKISSTTSLDTRTLQTTSIHSLQNLDSEGKTWNKSHIPLNVSDLKKSSNFPRKASGTGDILDPYSSHSEPVFPMTFATNQCKKCFHFKRGGEFLRSQQVLQSKVGLRLEEASGTRSHRWTLGHEYLSHDKLKIVMERNKVLEDRAQEMKKEMEKLQAESKKLKTAFYNTNKEKVAYEKFVKDFIKSLEKDSVVRVVNGNTEFLVKKVNYVGMEEHPRDKKTSKRERELKAVIGLQEITIRNLISSLQEKAKSVSELNQTVKLAQAFSAARDDSREYGSDNEETDEVSNSELTTEYEFSLTKPPPPDDLTVEDTDAVLHNIRRTTEMELKDIGISRSLGKSSSRDSESELDLPNISVRSYQNTSEGILPKKPRLFDNLEDCWPFPESTPKIVQRKIIESNIKFDDENPDQSQNPEENTEETIQTEETNSPEPSEPVKSDPEQKSNNLEMEGDFSLNESFYDACEAFNTVLSPEEPNTPREPLESKDTNAVEVFKEKEEKESEDDKNDKNNFLITAIIPRDLDVKPEKNVEDWLKGDRGDSEEKKSEASEKGKKFTCQLSIDFATKVLQNDSSEGGDLGQQATENGVLEENQSEANESFELVPKDCQVHPKDDSMQKENPLLSVKKCKKCFEIKITQVEEKENQKKNFLHQKMVVKFGKDSQPETDATKSSKFEFNFAVSGIGEKGKFVKMEQIENEDNLKLLHNLDKNAETNLTPRTVWNDAADEIAEVSSIPDDVQNETPQQKPEVIEPEEDKQCENFEVPPKDVSDINVYQDSLRYEKNLEFLHQKPEEKIDENESKDKPTAILIQTGQTKLALIRYQ